MTEPAPFSGRRAPLLFGLLFVTAVLAAVVVWVPLAPCPTCGGSGSVVGAPRLVLEENRLPNGEVERRRIRKPWPTQCPDCDLEGRISVLKKWQLKPWKAF